MLCSSLLCAQRDSLTVERLNLCATHLEEAGRARKSAVLTMLIGGGVAGLLSVAASKSDEPSYDLPIGVAALSVGISIGLDLSSASHLRRAGRSLR